MTTEKLFTRQFVLACVVQLGMSLSYFLTFSTIGLFARTLSSAEAIIGLATGLFAAASLVSRFVSPAIMKRIPYRSLLFLGLSLCFLSGIGYLFSSSITLLIAMRLLNGFGYGLASLALATIISTSLPPRRLLEGLGYSMMVITVCTALGPTIALTLCHNDGTRFFPVFVATLACVVLAFAAATQLASVKAPAPAAAPESVDEPATKSRFGLPSCISLATLVILLLAFLMTGVQTSYSAYLNLYAADYEFGNMSLFFIIFAITNFGVRLIMNRLIELLTERIVFISATVLLIVGFTGLFIAPNAFFIFGLGIIFGLAYGVYFPLISTKTLKSMPMHEQGLGNNLVLGAEDIGFAVGGSAWSMVAVAVGGYRNIYIISIFIALLMLAIVLYYPRLLKKKNVSEELW